MEILTLSIDAIIAKSGTQSRVELNQVTVAEYAEFIRAGGDLPPVVVFEDGSSIWLADGFHRFHAHRAAGAMEISCDVRQGTQRDAILYSVGANATHGLRRTNEDKRRAVMTLLNDAEWAAWSARDIAKACGVSHTFVDSVKSSLATVASDKVQEVAYTTKHGTQATMNTANIGKVKQAPVVTPEKTELSNAIKEQSPSEIDDLKIEVESLRERFAEVQADAKETLSDNEMMGRVFDADDKLKAAMDEAKRQAAIAAVATQSFNAQQGKVIALTKQVTHWQKRALKAEKILGAQHV